MSYRRFAEDTSVPVERSTAALEEMLRRAGCLSFARGTHPGQAVVEFAMKDRRIRLRMKLPAVLATQTSGQRARAEQEHRRLWRALLLVVKAKLEGVRSGIETFEEAFLPHIVMPDGKTMAELVIPQIAVAYKSGKMPPLLPGLGETGQ